MPLPEDERVEIIPASSDWALEFRRIADVLEAHLGVVGIEHIGSTAVAGLDAKPIIDMVIVTRTNDEIDRVQKGLPELGYYSEGEKGIPGRYSFGRTVSTVPRGLQPPIMDHHLYLTMADSEFIRSQRLFRDYLVAHPRCLEAYAVLKRALAREFGSDRDIYTEKKTAFVKQVLAAACLSETIPAIEQEHIGAGAFSAVDMRVGTVVDARPHPNARKPAIVLDIDFGPLGRRISSARLTDRYAAQDLLGEQVVAAVNLGDRQIGSIVSQCLVLGIETGSGTTRLRPDDPTPNGARVY